MAERDDLLSRLRSVDAILAGARPRPPREAELLAKLRAADRARQPPSSRSASLSPSPSLWLSLPLQRAWRPLGVTAALCAAFALALALRAGDHARRSAEAETSRGDDEAEALALDREPEATRLSSTKSAPRPRAEAPGPRSTPLEVRDERRPTTIAPELPEEPPRRALWDDNVPSPSPHLSSPQLSSSDETPPERAARISSAARANEEPRVLWAEGRSEAAPRPASTPLRRGQATSPSPAATEPRTDGCEPAETLIDRARAACEAQALTLSDRDLTTLDACGDGRFRGLEYTCAPAHPTHAPPNSKAPAGCLTEDLPLDGACKPEDDLRLEALQWCEEAGLTLAGLILDQGTCNEGSQGAHLLCCEKDSAEAPVKALPRTKQACSEDGDPDCED
jgi:hypothetical protein